ncbi:MAG TPA: GTP cyclohydrolase II [Burkholderiaceae bacterium]|nr:GTP cyclohydrolase II [Burkholderiaceae bacterium]
MNVTVRTQVPLPIRRKQRTMAQLTTFDGLPAGAEHFALVFGDLLQLSEPWVRLHSECVTGDVFGSARCDCGQQLDAALARMAIGGGVMLYLRQEGRGIGLAAKAAAYALQDQGLDTYSANEALGLPADARDYRVAAAMLRALGVGRVHLLSANPHKARALTDAGIELVAMTALAPRATRWNKRYLKDKHERFAQPSLHNPED